MTCCSFFARSRRELSFLGKGLCTVVVSFCLLALQGATLWKGLRPHVMICWHVTLTGNGLLVLHSFSLHDLPALVSFVLAQCSRLTYFSMYDCCVLIHRVLIDSSRTQAKGSRAGAPNDSNCDNMESIHAPCVRRMVGVFYLAPQGRRLVVLNGSDDVHTTPLPLCAANPGIAFIHSTCYAFSYAIYLAAVGTTALREVATWT